MKLPTTYSQSEKEKMAHELWSQFNRREEESFWKQYQKLVVKEVRLAPLPPKDPVPKPETVTIPPRTFHNLVLSYHTQLVFLIGTLGLFIAFLIEALLGDEDGFISNIIIAFFLSFPIWMLYRFTIYNVSSKGLLVIRDIILRKKVFIWDKIHTVELYRDEYDTTRLVIWLKSNQQYRFKYPLLGYQSQDFIAILQQKGVKVVSLL